MTFLHRFSCISYAILCLTHFTLLQVLESNSLTPIELGPKEVYIIFLFYILFRLHANTTYHISDITLVNVYVDLVVFTRIAGTLKTGSGRYLR